MEIQNKLNTSSIMNNEDLLMPAALSDKGVEIFGNEDNFYRWLKMPFSYLEETPGELMIKPGGIELLLEELDRLAQGYPV